MARWRIILNIAGGLVLAGTVGTIALARWAIDPYPLASVLPMRTAGDLIEAPFAERIVIGDSRVEWGQPSGSAVFMGYGGATFRDLERLTVLSCTLSDAKVTVALGINDTFPHLRNHAATLASLDAMIAACGAQRLRVAQIWPVEPLVKKNGGKYDLAAIAAINASIADRARTAGIAVIPAPAIAGHTIDGVHFDPATSARYMAVLGEGD